MGRFEPTPGLDAIIAERIAAPYLDRALDMLQDEARRRAPAVRVWVTARDDRVRPEHVAADGQEIPTNLKFRLDDGHGGTDLAAHPRDPDLPAGQRIGCRCADPSLPHPLRDSIRSTGVRVTGARVTGSVETRYPRAAESEYESADPALFMTGALHEVALRLRSGHTR